MTKPKKSIRKIVVEVMEDPDPDLSYLGEISSTKRKWSVDRQRKLKYAVSPRWRFFIPTNVPTPDMNHSQKVATWKDVEAAYKRYELYLDMNWYMMGIKCTAKITVNGVCQSIHSGGIWGVESDCGREYQDQLESEELTDLANQLQSLGFSRKRVLKAMEKIERK